MTKRCHLWWTDDAVCLVISSFEAKKMRRIMIMLPVAAVLMSCGLRETGERKDEEDIWTGPGFSIMEDGEGPFQKTVWYVTGFDYPDGYDWRNDPGDGSVRCSLVVFANAIPMMKIPVNEAYETSGEPDMHRMVDGNLYTEYVRDSVTVIRRNGRPFLEYTGEEKIYGLLVEGNDIYTLGQSRSGRGFTYRRNGRPLLSRDDGYVFEYFRRDSLGHCFAFCEPIKSVSGTVERYFICVGGKVSQIAVREDIKKVWDVTFHDGKLCYIASLVGVEYPVYVEGEWLYAMDVPSASKVQACRFVKGGNEPYIEGLIVSQNGLKTSGIWKGAECVEIFTQGMTVLSICAYDDGLHAILTTPAGISHFIYRAGKIFPVPEGYLVMGMNPMAMVDGILHVGLSPVAGGRPMVWRDGEIQELRLNGYVASVTAGQTSQDTVRD